MKLNLKKYFLFKKKDRIGILVMFFVVLVLFALNILADKFVKNENDYDFSEFSTEVDSFLVSLEPVETQYVSKLDSYIIARYDTLDLFMFNPNTVTAQQWEKLGLTKKQIKTINNYVSKGGRFVIKDDFRKIYGIRTKQYQILKPYIDLPEKEYKNYKKKSAKNKPVNLFDFDPNTASDSIFEELGLTKKQISSIIKYRQKGGRFYKKEDFKKIYTISDEDYNRLAEHIIIYVPKSETKKQQIPIIDINTATAEMFDQLPNIGEVFSNRIVKYRKKLGGFYKIEQIAEVYGLKTETFDKIKPYLTVSEVKLTKININLAEYKDLVKHPYIDSQTANKILKYKSKNGFYTSIEILSQKKVIDKKVYDKVKFYLTV